MIGDIWQLYLSTQQLYYNFGAWVLTHKLKVDTLIDTNNMTCVIWIYIYFKKP
jgi:hypothetical protein